LTPDKRPLGQTGIHVTPIGLGLMQLSGPSRLTKGLLAPLAEGETDRIVNAALDGGINWFDTAAVYGGGRSERALAAALSARGVQDADVIVGTKWFPLLKTAGNIPKTIGQRIANLGAYSIDLYMAHAPIGLSPIEAEMRAMADLVEAGQIRSVGVSNFNPKQMRRAHAALKVRGLPLAVNQVHFSLTNRTIEASGVMETARELGVTIVAYSPLDSGLLTGRFHDDPQALAATPAWRRRRFEKRLEQTRPLIEALRSIGTRYSATPAQVALNWLIHAHGETVVAIPGASSAPQASNSAGAMDFRLTADDLAQLDGVSKGA
jgi:aryl-alcohol dehydrogenase-like predicted oxidoreductase